MISSLIQKKPVSTPLRELLKRTYVDGIFHTHVSMTQPYGKYQLNRESIEDLWKIVCDLSDDDSKEEIMGIAEKPSNHLPVLGDFDIKILDSELVEERDHIYSENHIKEVIGIYQSVLRNIVDGCTDKDLTCVLLEKPIYYKTTNDVTYCKNGFHLAFMNIFLSKEDQEIHLFPRIKELIKSRNVFEDLGFDDSSKILDDTICRVPWLIYGSRKAENMQPYKVTKVYNSQLEVISLEEAFQYYQIYDIHEQLINIKGRIQYYLPRILSTIPYGRRINELKHGIVSPLKSQNNSLKTTGGTKEKKNIKVSVEDDLKVSERLLPMLAHYRCSEYNEWMTIGWILYNIG